MSCSLHVLHALVFRAVVHCRARAPLFESDSEGKDQRCTVRSVTEKQEQICRN